MRAFVHKPQQSHTPAHPPRLPVSFSAEARERRAGSFSRSHAPAFPGTHTWRVQLGVWESLTSLGGSSALPAWLRTAARHSPPPPPSTTGANSSPCTLTITHGCLLTSIHVFCFPNFAFWRPRLHGDGNFGSRLFSEFFGKKYAKPTSKILLFTQRPCKRLKNNVVPMPGLAWHRKFTALRRKKENTWRNLSFPSGPFLPTPGKLASGR